ncbi:unnamed protein product [Anisakis simplex]|uniref:ShKT domain-containing protein n=1 Tax=Anisakis simplex TaxID=6269 RepID=A0A0M3K9D1_ANISI|nr:unnamed protein product [Anisakis simplex]
MHLSAFVMIFVVRSVLGYYPPQRYNDVCEDDGKTDCASKISLCTDELFGEMMRAHCKKTCGLCGNEEDEEYYEQVGGGGGSNAGEGDGTEDYTEESQTGEETTDPSDEDEYPTDEETEHELPVPVIRPMACADTSADCKGPFYETALLTCFPLFHFMVTI